MKSAIKIFISFLVSLVCLYFATCNVHWGELKAIIANVKLFPLFITFLAMILGFWLRAVRWQILLQPFQPVPQFPLFRWQIGSLLINNLLPLRMGELGRAYWAGHKTTISKSTVFATIVIERILDLATIALIAVIFLLLTGLVEINSIFTLKNGILIALIGCGTLAVVKFYISKISKEELLNKLKSFLPHKIHSIFEKFLHGLRVIKEKKEFSKVSLISPIIWSVDITIILIVSYALNLNISWLESGIVFVGLLLGVMIPAAPGAAGTYEAGGVAALTLLGVGKTLALSFILLLHSFQYFVVLILGIPILIMEGFNPKTIFQSMRNQGD